MNYKEFTEYMADLLHKRLGPGYEIKVTQVTKNNDVHLTGVVMMRPCDRISPTIYLEEPYRQYCMGIDIQEIAGRIIDLYREHRREFSPAVNFFREFEKVSDRIMHKVIHYEKNRKLLEDVPHIRWCNLAVVFYYAIEDRAFGKASILIRNEHIRMWDRTAQELYRIAQDNMRRSMPELLVPMTELIEQMTGAKPPCAEEINLYVLTNCEKMYGASAMLYSDKIRELADRLHSDLLILPSSVHEVLLLPDDGEQDYGFYRRMVDEVNTTQVEPEEILSYSLYRYWRERAEIEEIFV